MPDVDLPEWLQTTLLFAGLLAMIFGPTTLVAMVEKRLIWPYVPLDERGVPQPLASDPAGADLPSKLRPPVGLTGASAVALTQARLCDFLPVATCGDGKGRIYRIRYDFWLAPDQEILALIGGGTIGGIVVQSTRLMTLLDDGRCLVTIDEQKGSEFDLSRMFVEALVAGASFVALLAHHRGRLAASAGAIRPFSATEPLADLLRVRTERVDFLASRGLVRFVDPDRNAWKYTFRGALRYSIQAIGQGIRRVIVPDRWLARFRPRRQVQKDFDG